MTRPYYALVLAALTTLAACGGASHDVSRAYNAPMSFVAAPDYDASTSQRAAVDLLSF